MSDRNEATGSEIVAASLRRLGVRQAFGVPGTTEISLLQAVLAEEISYMQCLHEAAAAGMADGYARAASASSPPLLITHSAQGTLNCLGMLRVAKRDRTPIIHIAGLPGRGYSFRDPTHQLTSLADILRSLTSWTWQVEASSQLVEVIKRAHLVTTSLDRGPVSVLIPQDILDAEVSQNVVGQNSLLPDDRMTPPVIFRASQIPRSATASLASVLAQSRNPLIFIGPARLQEYDVEQLVRLAERLNAVVLLESASRGPALLHRNFPLKHRLCIGYMDRLDEAKMRTIEGCDLVLSIGERNAHPRTVGDWITNVPVVQVDDDPGWLGRNHDIAIGMSGPFEGTLAALLDATATLTPGTRTAAQSTPAKDEPYPSHECEDSGICPVALASQVSTRLQGNELLVDDSQSFGKFLKTELELIDSIAFYIMGSTGSHLGWGLPAAVGASIARGGSPTIAVISDGSLLLEPQALWNAAKASGSLMVVVIDNKGSLSLTTESQHNALVESAVNYLGAGPNLAQLAESFGIPASVARNIEDIDSSFESWRQEGGSRVVVCQMSTSPACWDRSWFVPSPSSLG